MKYALPRPIDPIGITSKAPLRWAILVSVLVHIGLLSLPATTTRSKSAFSNQRSAARILLQLRTPTQQPLPANSPPMETLSSDITDAPTGPQAQQSNALSFSTPEIGGYLPSDALDQRPQMIEELPVDPPELRHLRQGGTLVMTLLIDESGLVIRALLERTDLPQAFVDATRQGMSLVRFTPGIKDGRPVKSQLRLEVRYRSLDALEPEPGSAAEQPLRLPRPPLRPALSAEGN